jgi:hypothetical protein
LAARGLRRNIAGVNEIQRLAYLEAMGIDSYISRQQLPAAAPTRRLRLLPALPAEKSGTAAQSITGAEGGRMAASDGSQPGSAGMDSRAVPQSPAGASDVAAIRESLRTESTTNAASETRDAIMPQQHSNLHTSPVFSVSACFLGGWCWLDEIPRGWEVGNNYLQLLAAMCVALGLEADTPFLDRFDWPMHHTRQLDQGLESARHGFEGFIRARLERYQVGGIILMGEMQGGWLERDLFAPLQLVETVSAWHMLKQPQLKVQAWRDLGQRLGSRG